MKKKQLKQRISNLKCQVANLATSNARLARELQEGEEIIKNLKEQHHKKDELIHNLRIDLERSADQLYSAGEHL